jgi:hypothetical protein
LAALGAVRFRQVFGERQACYRVLTQVGHRHGKMLCSA